MVREKISLKQLQKDIARERAKAKTASQRSSLEKELKQLREGTSTKLLKRFGRGFVVLTKKGAKATGRGIVKARKFAVESGAGEGIDRISFASAFDNGSARRAMPRVSSVTKKVIAKRVTTRRTTTKRRSTKRRRTRR